MKGVLLTLELMVAIMAFSIFITAYLANVYIMQAQETSAVVAYSAYLNKSSTLQSALYGIDLKNLSAQAADSAINSSTGERTYTSRLFPLKETGVCSCITRVLVENGSAYYVMVYYNETSDEH